MLSFSRVIQMTKPIIDSQKTVYQLNITENNPRNSEGDFAELNDGSILFAYSRYTGNDAHDDASCDIAGLISFDKGNTFKPLDHLLATAKELNTKNIMSVSLQRLQNGTLCLIYLCKKGPNSEVWLKRADTSDETKFGEPELCIPQKNNIYYVVNNSRTCITDTGNILLPLAQHPIKKDKKGNRHGIYYGYCKIFSSDQNGANWHELSDNIKLPLFTKTKTGLQEPGLLFLPDGKLYCYFRTDLYFQYESISEDYGKTWSKPVKSQFSSPDSPLLIRKNPYSNKYYAIWNPIPNYNGRIDLKQRWVNAGRTPFVIAESDDGINFSHYTIFEDDPKRGYCYPAIHFLNDKEMLVSYCCGGPDEGMCLTTTRITKLTLK